MKPWTLIDRTQAPDGKSITLHEHDGNYYIRVDGVPLMSTHQHTSEERLAEVACAHIAGVPGARILIGGLGFGFTLRAALAAVARDARVTVAEILSAVIEWNRNPAFPLAAGALADPRVTIVQRDVAAVIRATRAGFDAIVLDVDNGPAAMSTATNARLYGYEGLRATYAALRRGGCAAWWSAAPDPVFAELLVHAGFTVELHRSRARGASGARHTIFLGRAGSLDCPSR